MRTRCRANIPASPTSTAVQNHTGSGGNAILLRGGTDYALLNSVIVGPAACLDIDETGGTTTRAADARAAGSRPAGLPLGPARLPDRLPQRRQRHHGDDRGDLRHGHQQQQRRPRLDADRHRPYHQRRQRDRGARRPIRRRSTPMPPRQPSNAAAPNRLTAVTYIGAVRDAADTWYAGWTCNSRLREFRRRQRHLHHRPDLLIAAASRIRTDGGRR